MVAVQIDESFAPTPRTHAAPYGAYGFAPSYAHPYYAMQGVGAYPGMMGHMGNMMHFAQAGNMGMAPNKNFGFTHSAAPPIAPPMPS